MRLIARFSLLAAALAVALATATSAVAAPVAWERIDITRHSGQGDGVMLVAGILPEGTPLPAEAELAVPAGSRIQWIGEILGGAAEKDPELEYTKTTAGGTDLYRVVLTKSHIAQIEMVVQEGQTFDGTAYASAVGWTAPADVAEVRLNIRVPQAARIAKPVEGATLLPGETGYAYYTKTYANVKAGERLDLAAVYTIPTAAGGGPAAGGASGSGGAVPILLVLLGLAAAAGVIVAVRGKLASKVAADEDGAADDDGAFEAAEHVDDRAADEGDEPADDEEAGVEPGAVGMSSGARRNLVTAGIIVVLVIAAVAVGARTTRPQATGDTISQTFSAGEPCETTSVAIKDAGDPQATAKRLFEALGTMTGLKAATYNVKTGTIDVGYCESQTSAGAVKEVLSGTGLVAPGGSALPTATP